MRRTCGNCQHFGKEPNTPSRGCCFFSAEFDYYVVRGAHEKGCDDWAERKPSEEIVRCGECKYVDTMKCPVKRALVFDRVGESACVAPGGYCAWGERREDA